MDRKLIRVTREEIEPLYEGVARALEVLAEVEPPASWAAIRFRITLAASTVRAAGQATVRDPNWLRTFESAALALDDCMDLTGPMPDSKKQPRENSAWCAYSGRLHQARGAVLELRMLEPLVNTAVASEEGVLPGTPDEELPAQVKADWIAAKACLYRVSDFARTGQAEAAL